MTVSLGYLLPTRELCMAGVHETRTLLALADRAEALGLDSVWVGDSLLAKPRHEPLALLAAIAARTRKLKVGTAVLLPVLRNPVLLAHQAATIDQISEGRLILGMGIGADVPAIRAEFESAGVPFEKRVGRLLEGIRLCRALWTGEPVDWEGRWTVKQGALAPKPWTKGGPPIWGGGGTPAMMERSGKFFDGWFPAGPGGPASWGEGWTQVKAHAKEAGRDPASLVGAAYLTLSIDDDENRARAKLDQFLQEYYRQPGETIRKRQYCFAGSRSGALDWLREYAAAGATHLALRFIGEHEKQMELVARFRGELN